MAAHDYQTRPFLRIRRAYLDVLDAGRRRRLIHGLIEVDVTQARRKVREAELSFTGYVCWCLAQAVVEDPIVQGYRQRNRIVIFDDVDINTQIEVEEAGQKIVKSIILKAANRASVAELSTIIQQGKVGTDPTDRRRYWGSVAFFSLPTFLRSLPLRYAMANPFLFRRLGGTVGLSSVGMFGSGGGWAIPITPTTLMVTVGGIAAKPRFVNGQLCEREILDLTLTFDHTIVDGAPAARLAARLTELIETCQGL